MTGGLQDLKPGDVVAPGARVIEVEGRRIRLASTHSIADGDVVAGEAELTLIPASRCRPGDRLERLVAHAGAPDPLPIAVVWPTEKRSLDGAIEPAERGLAKVLLSGDRARLEAAARAPGADLAGLELVQASDSDAAAALSDRAACDSRRKTGRSIAAEAGL